MSSLRDLYDTRAARADADADADTVLAVVRGQAELRTRRRRHVAAAGTGIAGVAALIVGLAVLVPGDDDAARRPDAPAGGGSSSAAASATATSTLVPIDPAPASAEVSIELVPEGWTLLSAEGPNTLYGPARLRDSSPDDFLGKLLVSVHERIGGDEPHPLTIAGHPGSYSAEDGTDAYQGVDVILDATTEVNIQLPVSAGLSRADVLRLAGTLDVRSTTEKTHG